MAYEKLNWVDLPNRSTPVSAARLNHSETQYDEAVATSKAYTDAAIGAIDPSQASSIDLVARLRYPLYIAHRGSLRVYPEHSIEAYRASYEAGYSPEADVRALADGTLVCIHDATTNRTMSIAKPVNALTQAEWRSAKVLPPTDGITKSYRQGTPVFFDDYLNEFGGKMVLWPEAKEPSVVSPLITAVLSRGLHKSVVIQSADLNVCREVVNQGLYALFLSNGTTSAAEIRGTGVEFVGVQLAATNAYVTSLVDAGLKVIPYTANTKADAQTQFDRGCLGVFSDNPWAVDADFTPVSVVDINGFIPKAMSVNTKGAGTTQTVEIIGNRISLTPHLIAGADKLAVQLGELGEGTRIALTFTAQGHEPDASVSQGTWLFGVYFGSTQDGNATTELETDRFRLAVARRSGGKDAFEKRTAAAATPIGTVAPPTTPYAPAGKRSKPIRFELLIEPTKVTLKNLTDNDTDLVATTTAWPSNLPMNKVTFAVQGAGVNLYDIEARVY